MGVQNITVFFLSSTVIAKNNQYFVFFWDYVVGLVDKIYQNSGKLKAG